MLINTLSKELDPIINWLNDEYPYLSVVMYDIGARYGIHYLYTQLLNLQNFSVIGFEPEKQESVKLDESHRKDELNVIKSFLFSLIHKNVNYAANIIRKSNISEVKKIKILNLISQPLVLQNQPVNPDCLHVNSKIELRKINEDWWQNQQEWKLEE